MHPGVCSSRNSSGDSPWTDSTDLAPLRALAEAAALRAVLRDDGTVESMRPGG